VVAIYAVSCILLLGLALVAFYQQLWNFLILVGILLVAVCAAIYTLHTIPPPDKVEEQGYHDADELNVKDEE
jgi:membrane protein YdbS with pleckstrin-like domain